MTIAQMNWQDVERAVALDNRCVLPIGSTEQHSNLSLCVDPSLPNALRRKRHRPWVCRCFPSCQQSGLAPYFTAYPGTITLRLETLMAVIRDVVQSLYGAGFRRILNLLNGHGGNNPAEALVREIMAESPDASIKFHSWWSAPKTWAKVQDIDPSGTHANWMENFPRTRLAHAPRASAPAKNHPWTSH